MLRTWGRFGLIAAALLVASACSNSKIAPDIGGADLNNPDGVGTNSPAPFDVDASPANSGGRSDGARGLRTGNAEEDEFMDNLEHLVSSSTQLMNDAVGWLGNKLFSMSSNPNVNGHRLYVVDSRAGGIDNGGSMVAGVWQVRQLNTIRFDIGGNVLGLSDNVLTLGAGSYVCDIRVPGYYVNQFQARLVLGSGGTEQVFYGTSEFSYQGAPAQTNSEIVAHFTLPEPQTFRIEFRCLATNNNGNGGGVATQFSAENIYTTVDCKRIQ